MNTEHNLTQAKIKHAVSEYKRLFPAEYASFVEGQREKKKRQTTSAIQGTDFLQRPLCEWPDTLDRILKWQLTDDEWSYIAGDKTYAGIRWMAKEFPEFRLTDKI